MATPHTRQPKPWEIVSLLIVFLTIMFLSVSKFDLPIQLGLFASWFLVIFLGIRLGHTYDKLQKAIMDGIYNGLEAVLILVAVGALIGTWIAGGVVPSIIYYGLQIIHPSVFLLAAFFICALTSLSTGTSYGSAGTAGIAMMSIGASFGIPLPLVAGTVISGVYVGDKLSPLSDTTVMTASLAKVNVIEHVKSMLYVAIPALIMTAILFTVIGFFYIQGEADLSQAQVVSESLTKYFNTSWYMFIPAAVVVTLLALKKPAIPTIALGAFLGIVWAVLFQGTAIIAAIETTYNGYNIESGVEFLDGLLNNGGIVSMLDVIMLVILALGFGGLLEYIGVLNVITESFSHWVTNTGRLTLSTIIAAFFGNLFGSSAYVSLITGVKMTEKNYDKMKVDHRVLSRNTEAGGTITTPMIPWTDGALVMSTVLGVSTLAYLPFMWFNFIAIIITVLFGFTGKFIWYTDDKEISNSFQETSQNTEIQL